MTELAELRPTQHHRMIDLVSEAGLDISDWTNFKGGAARAGNNPKYCYEWAFVQPNRPILVNLPHQDMREREGRVLFELNLRELSSGYGSKPPRKNRLERLARALELAYSAELPIRVIVFDGKMGDKNDSEGDATRVEARRLDPVSWAVTNHDLDTGDCVLTRGAHARPYVDQFSIGEQPNELPERREALSNGFVRNPLVRRRARERARGRCEYCGERGFEMADGAVYLETHHVLPLSDGGLDTLQNVVALCANHHREAHHGARASQLRSRLREVLEGAREG